MRIVAGAWRGRRLQAPEGMATRPTADRVRQALFDMLTHAPWAGRGVFENALVLDSFAGAGGLGLEALSRGAAQAWFIEQDKAALAALRANIAACRAAERCKIIAADMTRPPPGPACGLVFLDPPYGQNLVAPSIERLKNAGWIAPGALIVAELGRDDPAPLREPLAEPLAERVHGAARIMVWRSVAE